MKIKFPLIAAQTLLNILLSTILFASAAHAHAQSQSQTISNPILPGFTADPSIIRVGSDYYLATSTFEYFPAVPIYHSKDLANWTPIGHALHRPEQMELSHATSSRGIFAPTLRYHEGTFYMITTLAVDPVEGLPHGNFYVTAKNPAGPWSDPVWLKDAPGIDSSLFFDDDGRVYYSGNGMPKELLIPKHRIIWTQELDLKTNKFVGERYIFDPAEYIKTLELGPMNNIEGPHIYKRNGYYYLLASHGGTGLYHAVSIWRSKSISGPWENNPDNPIATHVDLPDHEICCIGHADLVEGENGEWWVAMLGIQSSTKVTSVMGRQTFLAPVDWSGEWPIVNKGGNEKRIDPTLTMKGVTKLPNFNFYDDFSKKELDLNWNTIRTPKTRWWDLTKKRGKLAIQLRAPELENFAQPSFLGVRVAENKVYLTAEMEFEPKNEREQAGIAIERGHKAEWTFVKELAAGKPVLSAYHDGELKGRSTLESLGIKMKDKVTLRIHLDNLRLMFLVKRPKDQWHTVAHADAITLGFGEGGEFTGSYAGVYASSRGEDSKNYAYYDWFSMEVLKP